MSGNTEENISRAAWVAGEAARVCFERIEGYHATWSSAMKPKLFKDGDMWCALHGADLQVGIAGFGPTPANALMAFDMAMCSESGSHIIDRQAPAVVPTPREEG